MNEFKGTPGPWKIVSGKLGDDGSEIEAENSEFWAFVSFDTPEAERIPNANLIAAAPELLEALKGCMKEMETYSHVHHPGGADGAAIFNLCFNFAKAALRKALGEQP